MIRRAALLLSGFTALALPAALLMPGAASATTSSHIGNRNDTVKRLRFLGQQVVPTGTQFRGTEVGGLSGITYDPGRARYYALSDDPSQIDPARFYTLRITLQHGGLTDHSVHFTDVTTLKDTDGQPFAPLSLDPEGIALTRDRNLIITSEGDSTRLIPPFVREFSLRGKSLDAFPVPAPFLPTADSSTGVRLNLAFESSTLTRNRRTYFTATENALFQDGPAATLTTRSPSRILQYDARSRRLEHEFVYVTDKVAQPPVPAGAFSVNGVAELLPLDRTHLLALERSFSVGVGNTIKLYEISLRGATDVKPFDSIAGHAVRPVHKKLLLDLSTLGITLDNLEGMTFGPRLSDGRRSLILVSDNNFDPAAFTQFLAFSLPRRR